MVLLHHTSSPLHSPSATAFPSRAVAVVAVSLVTLLLLWNPVHAQPNAGPTFPDFPDLLRPGQSQRRAWERVGRMAWDVLVNGDFDFVDRDGNVMPPGLPGTTTRSPTACGRIARIWIRMPFHDCGTFSTSTKKGGCNGSLRKELPGTEPLLDAEGNVILGDVFDQLGEDRDRADVEFDPRRRENNGFAISTSFFYKVKFAAERFGLKASWVDIMVYSGNLAVAVCQGPLILFVPGREDSKTADVSGALPAPQDNNRAIFTAFKRMGLRTLDGVSLLSSHSTSCFVTGCLDSTPDRLDNLWAKELLTKRDVPKCKLPGTFPQDAQPRCQAPMDLELLKRRETKEILQLLAWSTNGRVDLIDQIADLVGSFTGILWRVNLCRPGLCDENQWAYFHLFATSYYRLTSLGLPQDWEGFARPIIGPQFPFSGQSQSADGQTTSLANFDIGAEVASVLGKDGIEALNERVTAWLKAYDITAPLFTRGGLNFTG